MYAPDHEHLEDLEPSELSYRGVDVRFDKGKARAAEGAAIQIGDRRYDVARDEHHGMWTAPGVFNMYSSLDQLARHMVDLEIQGLLPPPEEHKPSRRRKR